MTPETQQTLDEFRRKQTEFLARNPGARGTERDVTWGFDKARGLGAVRLPRVRDVGGRCRVPWAGTLLMEALDASGVRSDDNPRAMAEAEATIS